MYVVLYYPTSIEQMTENTSQEWKLGSPVKRRKINVLPQRPQILRKTLEAQ